MADCVRADATTVHVKADAMAVWGSARGFCKGKPIKRECAMENL